MHIEKMQDVFDVIKEKTDNPKVKELCQKSIEEYKTVELLFGGAAGGFAFFIIVGKKKLRKCKLGGVSAGSVVSMHTHYIIHQDKLDMTYFYKNYIRKLYENNNKKYYGFLTTGDIITKYGLEFYKLYKKNNIKTLNGNVHMVTTTIGKSLIPQKMVITEYKDSKELCEACFASCGVPLLLSKNLFYKFRGYNCIDGGVTAQIPYRFENSRKIFLNMVPEQGIKFPFIWKQPKNLKVINMTKDSGLSFPIDLWFWSEEWADEMFEKGMEKARQDKDMILEIFNEVFDEN